MLEFRYEMVDKNSFVVCVVHWSMAYTNLHYL